MTTIVRLASGEMYVLALTGPLTSAPIPSLPDVPYCRLTFYGACWAAATRALGVSLVSADTQLLHAGLAESPQAVVHRLRL